MSALNNNQTRRARQLYKIESTLGSREKCFSRMGCQNLQICFCQQFQSYQRHRKMKCQKSLTLREYLQKYNKAKRAESDQNLLSISKTQCLFVPTQELELQISQKLNSCKKILAAKSNPEKQVSALECLHELSKIVNQVLQKLKTLQGIDGNIRYTQQQNAQLNNNNSNKKVTVHDKKLDQQKTRKIKTQESVHKQLIIPQQMSKQIEFSKDLSNLSASITTQDASAKCFSKKLVEKAKKLGDSTSSQTYFRKRIKRIKSLGPELSYGQQPTADQYQIRVSQCNEVDQWVDQST